MLYYVLIRTLIHVEDADECEELAVDRNRAGRDEELGEGGKRERLEQTVPDRVERVGPRDAQPYLHGVVLVIWIHESVVHQEVGVGAHPVEYVHLVFGHEISVGVAHARVARLDEFGRQLNR